MSDYWTKRQLRTNKALTNKTIEETEKQLKKYYRSSMSRVIKDFEFVYDKVQLATSKGENPTPADLYKLNTYWQMQGELQRELEALGDKQSKLFSLQFMNEYKTIYEAISLHGDDAFLKANLQIAKQVVNEIWCADGLSWSDRIWKNTNKLAETLNEELIHCVVTGKKNSELKSLLQNRFGVSYHRADTLARTEIARIETQSSARRYIDSGVTYFEFIADPDERTCPVCGALDGKKFLLAEMKAGVNAPPMHPNDRCAIGPVVERKQKP